MNASLALRVAALSSAIALGAALPALARPGPMAAPAAGMRPAAGPAAAVRKPAPQVHRIVQSCPKATAPQSAGSPGAPQACNPQGRSAQAAPPKVRQ